MSNAVIDILNKWAEVTKYDPDQRSFNILSNEYEFHRCSERMTELSKEYDPTGTLAVLYAKLQYEEILSNTHIKLLPVIQEPNLLDDYQLLWKMFHSDEVGDIEHHLIQQLNSYVQSISEVKLVGDNATTDSELRAAIDSVCTQLSKCKFDVYLISGQPFGTLNNLSKYIRVRNTLAECLVELEQSTDGVYLCYIAQNNTCEGYFGIFLKSNGNIISVNDRVDERYVGQHSKCRNAHYVEGKCDKLFPYTDIVRFGDRDYKGYATTFEVINDEVQFDKISTNSYLPVVLAVMLLSQKYAGKKFSSDELVYCDSLMTVGSIESTAIASSLPVPVVNTQIVQQNRAIEINFQSAQITSGELSAEFDHTNKSKKYDEVGHYGNLNQKLVDTFGSDFVLDTSALLTNNVPKLEDGESNSFTAEFVGSYNRLSLQAYHQARQQLADHIKANWRKSFEAAGGYNGTVSWYTDLIRRNKDVLIRFAAQRYKAVMIDKTESNYEDTPFTVPAGDKLCVAIKCSEHAPWGKYHNIWINESKYPNKYTCDEYICPISDSTANVWFTFIPCSYTEIERLFGESVIEPVKGWYFTGQGYSGNDILESCDPVASIRSPYDRYVSEQDYPGAKSFNFGFMLGLSKRAINKLIKEI